MFPNERVRHYFSMCQELFNFYGVSWWIIDLEDNPGLFYCNDTMCETFSLDKGLTAHSVSETCPIAGDYNKNIAIRSSKLAKQIFDEYHQLRYGDRDEYNNRFPYYDQRNDETVYFSSRAKALLRDENGKAQVLMGIIEPETVSSELYALAKTDGLTGLYNRREFDAQLELLIGLAGRNNHSVSMIMCDIDYFKDYNDNLGHYAGDDCLRQVSEGIKRVCSQSIEHVFRYGGEEFAILVMNDLINVEVLAERIRSEIHALNLYHPKSSIGTVTISVGYATSDPSLGFTGQWLIERADRALYSAKQMGRNRVCSSEDSLFMFSEEWVG